MGLDTTQTTWLQRSYDLLLSTSGYENWGTAPNWYYEWTGWGSLTKERRAWMAGDAGTFHNGERISGMPIVPCSIAAVDYDYFPGNGEGKTYHNVGSLLSSMYRNDGTVEIAQDGSDNVVTNMVAGEWMSYTVAFPAGASNTVAAPVRPFNVYVTYKATHSGGRLFAAVADGEKKGKELAAASTWTERLLGTLDVPCGAATLRLFVRGVSNVLQVKSIRIEPVLATKLQSINLKSAATIKVYDASNNDVTASYPAAINKAVDSIYDVSIALNSQKYLVFDFGVAGLDILGVTLYNDGVTQDSREQAAVLGSTSDSSYNLAWSSGDSKTFLRTNGTQQGGLAVPVLTNNWSNAGVLGSYTVGPVGKFRYLAFYNWSAYFNASEIEVQTIGSSQIHNPDSEPSVSWGDPDPSLVVPKGTDGAGFHTIVHGNEVMVPGADHLVVYSLLGEQVKSVARDRVTLPRGVYFVKSSVENKLRLEKVVVH